MKIAQIERIIDAGNFSKTKEWQTIEKHIFQAIRSIDWPPGSGSFTLFNESGKKRGQGSGVKPIKQACMQKLKSFGWQLETPVDIATVRRPGPMDATYRVNDRLFCVEWETGNISSSHRSVNKMALGILKKILIGGALILPTREMYQYLTDRIGNFRELSPYFPLWKALDIREGLLLIIAIEHDAVSNAVPRIKKGTDGRALQ
ncbi:MAG: Type-2 restriction enzyme BamHI [Syntrophus sp. PtaB.Bin075]|nr:MAG: Type-2 restriction enzyme BamHI [Syntrophus sp. PtaB.Bin075]